MIRAHPTGRLLTPWLIGLALIVRALVPAGWMTAAAAGGGIALIPCTGVVPAASTADSMTISGAHHHAAAPHGGHHGGDGQQGHDGKPQQPCVFAGLALASTSSAPPALLAPVQIVSPAARPRQTRFAGRGLAAPPPPSTGPPSA